MVITSLQEKENRKFWVPIRDGNRGGWSLFDWQSVREMPYRDRQMYLGNSAVIGVLDKGGKWRKRDWYVRPDKKYNDPQLKSEQLEAIRRDQERMKAALGMTQMEDEQKLTEQEMRQLLKRIKNKEGDAEGPVEAMGLGFDKARVQIRAKPGLNNEGAMRLEGINEMDESEDDNSRRKQKKIKKEKKEKKQKKEKKKRIKKKRDKEREREVQRVIKDKKKRRKRRKKISIRRKIKKEIVIFSIDFEYQCERISTIAIIFIIGTIQACLHERQVHTQTKLQERLLNSLQNIVKNVDVDDIDHYGQGPIILIMNQMLQSKEYQDINCKYPLSLSLTFIDPKLKYGWFQHLKKLSLRNCSLSSLQSFGRIHQFEGLEILDICGNLLTTFNFGKLRLKSIKIIILQHQNENTNLPTLRNTRISEIHIKKLIQYRIFNFNGSDLRQLFKTQFKIEQRNHLDFTMNTRCNKRLKTMFTEKNS